MAEQFRKKRREILMRVSTGHLTPEQAEEALLLLEEEQLNSNGETAYAEMRREVRGMQKETREAKEELLETKSDMETIRERMKESKEWMEESSKMMGEAVEMARYAKQELERAGAEQFSKTTFEIVEDGCKGTADYQFNKSGGGIHKIKLPASFLSAYGGPVEGNVHVTRTDGPMVLIHMCGYFKADEKKTGQSFIDKMLPTVSIEDREATFAHPLADLKTLPDGIKLVFLEISITASEEVKTEFGALKTDLTS